MYELAKVYSENQDIDQSIEMLKKVIAINPYEDNSITELAEICNANNRNEEALVSFKSAIEMIEKESWYLLFRVGYLYHDIKQYSLAIPYYCDCEQLLKKDMDISFNLTDCYIKTNQFPAAKREVQKYLTYGGDNYRSIYLQSGLISIGLGEYK
jgi:tetratricopeptide (TPR) repeat protein